MRVSTVGIVLGYGVAAIGGVVALISILILQVTFANSGRAQTRSEYGHWGWETRPPALWGALGGLATLLAGFALAAACGAR